MMIRFSTEDRSFVVRDDGAGTAHYFERGTPDYDRLAPDALPYEAPPPDLGAARADALSVMARAVDSAARDLSGDVPEVERLSWTAKEMAARALVAGHASQADYGLLQLEVAFSGQEVFDLARGIIKNAEAYRAFIAAATGARRAAARLIEAAETVDQIGAAFDQFVTRLQDIAGKAK